MRKRTVQPANPSTPSISFADLPDNAYVRLPTVLAVFPVGRSTWWDGVKKGKYPAGHKLTANCTAWNVGSIRELLSQQKKAA